MTKLDPDDAKNAVTQALTAKDAEIERLVKERDAALANADTNYEKWGEQRARAEAAQARIAELENALVWCSGSADFQEGGRARVGWLKLCQPLLDTLTPKEQEVDN